MNMCLLLPALLAALLTGCVAAAGADGCADDAACAGGDCGPSGCACREGRCVDRCGDGVVDQGEECDDGGREDEDGCSSSCALEHCGDFVIQPRRGETCDPPGGDGCGALCTAVRCGDGVREGGEQCEPGVDEPACDPQRCACLARDLTAGYDRVVALREDGALLWFGSAPPAWGGPPTSLGPGRPALLAARAPDATRIHLAVSRRSLLLLEGDGSTARLLEADEPSPIGPDDGLLPAPAGERWVEAGGGDVFFALRTDAGRVFVISAGGQPGPGASTPRTLTELPGRWSALATGLAFVVLLAPDGGVYTVGFSTTGALGLGGPSEVAVPTRLATLSGCDRVSAAWQTSYMRCAPASDCGEGSDALGPRSSCTPGWFSAGLHGGGLSGIGDGLAGLYGPACAQLGLESSCVPRPHRLEEASTLIESFTGTTMTGFGLDSGGRLLALGWNARGDKGLHGNAHGIPDENGGDHNEVNQDRPKGVPGLERGVAQAVATFVFTSFVRMEDGTVRTSGEGCPFPNGLGVLPSVAVAAPDACHPTTDTCLIDAELFTTLSLCAAADPPADGPTLACGRP